jgi:hypothetical protein
MPAKDLICKLYGHALSGRAANESSMPSRVPAGRRRYFSERDSLR